MHHHYESVYVLYAPTAEMAREIEIPLAVTVEAEYGDFVVEGLQYTAAHHQKSGKYQGRHTGGNMPSPCCDPNIPRLQTGEYVLVSHIDLDTVGGVQVDVGYESLFTEEYQDFWGVAEFVDVHGPHRLDPSNPQYLRICSWWAWLAENRKKSFDRDQIRLRNEAMDITGFFMHCAVALENILRDDPTHLEAGRKFIGAEDTLNEKSWLFDVELGRDRLKVVIRSSDRFVNHLYRNPDGEMADAVLALNTETGSITLSFEDGGKRLNARDIIQYIFPDKDQDGNFLAGGHPGIAGSPRGKVMGNQDLYKAIPAFMRYLKEITPVEPVVACMTSPDL